MKIGISDTRMISEIQKEFGREFPFLRIEFFDVPLAKDMRFPKSKMFGSDKRLSLCRNKHNEGILSIAGAETVASLEQELWDEFGLSAQIFRKSGKLWIETSLTDAWTLERQNNEGRELSKNSGNNPYKDGEDTDFTDRDKWD